MPAYRLAEGLAPQRLLDLSKCEQVCLEQRQVHYLSEFDFRYNARKVDDGARRQLAIKSTVGKRLTYYPRKVGETDSVVG